jgi:DNA-binding transcriptional ArsR family regulator
MNVMSILTAFRLHYADLLNEYTLEHDCTLEMSLKKLKKSLLIKRQEDGTYEAYDAYSFLICKLKPELLAAFVDHKSELPDVFKTTVKRLLGRTLAEVIDPYPYLTAAQMLVTIDEFKQAVESEKVTHSAEIAAGTRWFASNISVTILGWEVELTCESYLYTSYLVCET